EPHLLQKRSPSRVAIERARVPVRSHEGEARIAGESNSPRGFLPTSARARSALGHRWSRLSSRAPVRQGPRAGLTRWTGEVLPEKCQCPLERELGGLRPPAVARRLGEPVTGPGVAVDDDAAPGVSERALEGEHRLIGLVRVGLREMA